MTTSHDPKTPSAPHDCPGCGAPAYIPFGLQTRCTSRECQYFDQDCWVLHVMELPDEDTEPGQYLDIEDEDTQPYLKMPSLSDLYANKGGLAAWPLDPKPLTPKQQKALDILEAAIDKIPVPYFKKPLDDD